MFLMFICSLVLGDVPDATVGEAMSQCKEIVTHCTRNPDYCDRTEMLNKLIELRAETLNSEVD